MDRQQAQDLLIKFNEGNASKEEVRILERWYIEESKIQNEYPASLDYARIQIEMWEKIRRLKQAKERSLWPRIVAAASVIICLSAGGYVLIHKKVIEQLALGQAAQLSPGSNKAMLTLSNGTQIMLSGAKNGRLLQQGISTVTKLADGKIAYNTAPSQQGSSNEKIIYNTITTPRAGQYNLILADGTRVWLNAASSIKYPTAFIGNDRQVELSGEAYFEVAHNRLKPFKVKSGGQVVEVLGTHFNINSYKDESLVKTDLLEGSIKISANAKTELLKPGQESVFSIAKSSIAVKEADTQSAIAWKNGIFSFKQAELPTVMRQIARWYDLDVSYEGTVPATAITGTVDRNVNALQFFQILKDLDIHFKIEGKRITILQK